MMVRLILSSRSLQRAGAALKSSVFGFNDVDLVHLTFLLDLAAKMHSSLRVGIFFVSSTHRFMSLKNKENHLIMFFLSCFKSSINEIPDKKSSSDNLQPKLNAGNTPLLVADLNLDEASLRTVTWAKYLSLYW